MTGGAGKPMGRGDKQRQFLQVERTGALDKIFKPVFADQQTQKKGHTHRKPDPAGLFGNEQCHGDQNPAQAVFPEEGDATHHRGQPAADDIFLAIEELTPTGMLLHQTIYQDEDFLVSEGDFRLETYENGQWQYLEPTVEIAAF